MLRKTHTFTEELKHKPDCSSVTDEELSAAIFSRFPGTTIHYSFSTLPVRFRFLLDWEISAFFLQMTSPEQLNNIPHLLINDALDTWSKASNGNIQFVQQTTAYPFTKAIYFILVNPSFLAENNAEAMTTTFIDRNHYIATSYVFLPHSASKWASAYENPDFIHTITHEIGHAIGFDHFHEFKSIKKKLENTNDGLFCSVMPYDEEITTSISQCYHYCNPPFAVRPGSLDERILAIAYNDSFIPKPPRIGESKWEDIGYFNFLLYLPDVILNQFLCSFLMKRSYQFVFLAFNQARTAHNAKCFSQKNAYLMTDISFSLLLYYFNVSPLITCAHLLIYLYEYKLNANKKFSQAILSIMLAVNFQDDPLSTLNAIGFSTLGTYVGSLPCPSLRKKNKEKVEPDIENPHRFFYRPRRSLCQRLMRLIGYKGNERDDGMEDEPRYPYSV